jgi:N-acetylneuraminate lyase
VTSAVTTIDHQGFKMLSSDKRLAGLVAATFTPLRADGSLHLERIPDVVDRLERDGVVGLYVLGSTGEGASLTAGERMAVAEAYVEAARGRLRTVIQVGHNSVAEARAFAEHAQRIGADAVSAMPPSYFKPGSVDALVDSLAEIARGAPELPFYYYHIPPLTGVDPDMGEFLDAAAERLPTLAGIKFSDCRLHDLQLCQRHRSGALDVVFGVDEMLLAAVALGVRGAVGSTYGFAAPLYLRVIDAFDRGDLERARSDQALAAEMVRIILRHCGRAGLKAVMSLIGLDCGPYRLPQTTAAPDDVARMARALEAIGFFEWGGASTPTAPAVVGAEP